MDKPANLNEPRHEGVCVICSLPFRGYGHNAAPVAPGRCCDVCNDIHVIPTRLTRIFGLLEKEP